MKPCTHFAFALPSWVHAEGWLQATSPIRGDAAQCAWVLDLLEAHIEAGTGGPFAAAVFDADDTLISVGLNLVPTTSVSVLHAEIVATMLAERAALTAPRQPALDPPGRSASHPRAWTLVTSTEPCAMCLGSIPWAGYQRVLCAGRGIDAEAVGFDEGHKPAHWQEALRERGTTVRESLDVARNQALLRRYIAQGGSLYGGTG